MRYIKKYLDWFVCGCNDMYYDKLPKKIYFFWYDGFDNIPEIVRINIAEWQKLNSEFEFIMIDKNYLSQIDLRLSIDYTKITIQAFSDILRANLLSNYGGVWVDCSVFPIKPLKEWLPKKMKTEFFAFHCYHAKDCLLSSWFLVAIKDSVIMQNWYNEVLRYWNKPRNLLMDPRFGDAYPSLGYLEVSPHYYNKSDSFPYFWFHYIFTYLVKTNRKIEKIWEKVPDISSSPLHELQNYMKANDIFNSKDILCLIKNKMMEKLDWRIDENKAHQFKKILTLENIR